MYDVIDQELQAFATAWDAMSEAAKQQANEPRPDTHVTPQMIYDIWRDGCAGPGRVAAIIRGMPEPQRAQIEVGYWNILRAQGYDMSLAEVRLKFELALLFR